MKQKKEIIKARIKANIENIIVDVFKDDPSQESIEATLRWLAHNKDYGYRAIFEAFMEYYEVESLWYFEELANKIYMDFWLKNKVI